MEKPSQAYYHLDLIEFSFLSTSTLRLAMCMSYKAQRIRIYCMHQGESNDENRTKCPYLYFSKAIL